MSYVVYTVPFLWATYYYCLSKLSNSGLSYSTLQTLQLLGYVAVLTYGFTSGNTLQELRNLKSNTNQVLTVLVATLSSVSASFAVYYSFRFNSPLLVATVELLYPAFLYVLLLLLKEKNFSYSSLLGLCLCVLGVYLVVRSEET